MRTSKIRAKLSRGETAICVTLHLTDPSIYEMTSLLGFDGIWMDLEHHGYSVEVAGQLMRAARVGSADIVARPAKGEFMRMSRLLEMGAQAIMYPRCDGPEEAAQVVRWSKFAPLGTRGFDGGNADAAYTGVPMTEYLAQANRETLVIIQLEHQQAVDQAEAIAALPGVDLIMLGPADFSILEGFPGQFDDPRIRRAMETIACAARNTGKHWACTAMTLENARQAIELGCGLVFHDSDLRMIKCSMERMQAQFAELGFQFESRLGVVANVANPP